MTGVPTQGILGAHLVRMLDADRWANRRVTERLRSIPNPPSKALDRLAHIATAQEIWLSRVDPAQPKPDGLFPTGVTLAQIEKRLDAVGDRWRRKAANMTDAEAHHHVAYTSTEGVSYASEVCDIITQLVTHGAYHRGQIAVDLKDLPGATWTDYIVFSRAKQETAAAAR